MPVRRLDMRVAAAWASSRAGPLAGGTEATITSALPARARRRASATASSERADESTPSRMVLTVGLLDAGCSPRVQVRAAAANRNLPPLVSVVSHVRTVVGAVGDRADLGRDAGNALESK